MTLQEKAANYLRNTGNYEVVHIQLSKHMEWSIVNLPLNPTTPNFATFYSKENFINFAVSLGFNTNG